MTILTLLSFYGIMAIMLLGGFLLKDRKNKYYLRMAGYWYMFFLNFAQTVLEEVLWLKLFLIVINLLWIYLAYKDFKSTKYFDREFARLDELRKESEARADDYFRHSRN